MFQRLCLFLLTTIAIQGIGLGQQSMTLDIANVVESASGVTRVWGSEGSGASGVPVAAGYDCNGDGHEDFAVAHLTASPAGRTRAGSVELVLGDGTIGPFYDTADTSDPAIIRVWGDIMQETCGSEVWMDDVDGDGLGDLLVCRQNYSAGAGRIGIGAVTILFGGPHLRAQANSLAAIDLRDLPTTAAARLDILGAAQFDRLGIWIRTGDVDGDGIADIVTAADQSNGLAPTNEDNRGAVYVIRGGAHLRAQAVVDLAAFGATPIEGRLARIDPPAGSVRYHLGATCTIGDLDGNGRGEVLAAAALNRAGAAIIPSGASSTNYQSSGGAPDGRLFILWDDLFPSGLWPVGFQMTIGANPTSETNIRGATYNISFGEETIGGKDYDNDGTADLFVGDLVATPPAHPDRSRAGAGYVIYEAHKLKGRTFTMDNFPSDMRLTQIDGPNDLAVGADTVTHGDYDGDGIADLAFSNPHDAPEGRTDAGSIVVFYGQDGGWPELIDTEGTALGADTRFRWARIIGANGRAGGDLGDTLCYSAAGGDIDGDGFDDVVTNEMVGNGSSGQLDVGNLLVISGRSLLERNGVAEAAWPAYR